MSKPPTIVSILTPAGRGAVATVAVMGEAAMPLVTRHFRPAAGKPLESFAVDRIVFGRWEAKSPGGAEDVVVCRRGGQRVEIHCHGGRAAARAIVDAMVQAGCHESPWTSVARSDEASPITAEARIALAAARTDRTAGILLDQYRGALQTAVSEIVSLLRDDQQDSARQRLADLLRFAPVGLHLTVPFRVVLAGPANVGKSSLINAILGYERAIVFDQPGTTRDVVSATTAIDGWPIELADTAGLRETSHDIELAGVRLAQAQIQSADLTLFVFDASQPWTDEHQRLIGLRPQALVVHNKRDLVLTGLGARPAGVEASALTGQGIAELADQISQTLVPAAPPAGAAVPFTGGQVALLESAAVFLDNGQVALAMRALGGGG